MGNTVELRGHSSSRNAENTEYAENMENCGESGEYSNCAQYTTLLYDFLLMSSPTTHVVSPTDDPWPVIISCLTLLLMWLQ